MESAQREVMTVLLRHIFSLGLISESALSKAEDLVRSVIDLPEFFQEPACLTEEVPALECAQDTQ